VLCQRAARDPLRPRLRRPEGDPIELQQRRGALGALSTPLTMAPTGLTRSWQMREETLAARLMSCIVHFLSRYPVCLWRRAGWAGKLQA
jgi:hypothetical protein